ncbi:hypothetical protein Dsin_027557 [Dipteronia sinensis]|uniref:Uncharacterized protein n=1 Tax=Dipteronia sinensis TaxID=43782 RepID=A0AAD9ZQF1_9ROSI|nr:hypothetical protein Dsin_027557 [Dipteronia sinensis]
MMDGSNGCVCRNWNISGFCFHIIGIIFWEDMDFRDICAAKFLSLQILVRYVYTNSLYFMLFILIYTERSGLNAFFNPNSSFVVTSFSNFVNLFNHLSVIC